MAFDVGEQGSGATTVMVVDDDEASLRLAARVLRAAGHTVLEASGARAALDLIADRRQPLDLLITDIVMPDMLGHELAERVEDQRPGTPVLCVSGSPDRYTGGERAARGPMDFLLKPYDGGDLRSAAAALLVAAERAGPAAPVSTPAPPAHSRRRIEDGGSEPAAAQALATTGEPSADGRWILPRGRTLPAAEWERRHRCIVWVLWAHVAALMVVGVVMYGLDPHGILHGAVVVPLALLAGRRRASHRLRQITTTFAMLSCSAIIVHLSGGAIEGHFHYFASIVLLSLYEDWVPFLIAILYVLLQHGAMGTIMRSEVYDHAGNPWALAAVHAAAVALTAAAATLAWRLNEDVRRTEAKVRDRLAHRALHDELTGLPNRRLLVEELERAAARCVRGQAGAAVLVADVDNFKLINDSFGHKVGDRLLVDLAARLRAVVRATDLVARSGGDEFVVIARYADGEDDAIAVATRIADAMRPPFQIGGAVRQVSLSVGIARIDADDLSVADALSRADAALHRAKADGRGRFQLADGGVLRQARRRMEVETALEDSTADQFELHYQPIVDLADGSIPAVEALLRWNHPSLGLVSPGEFIPIAEASGRILELGRWALGLACRQAVSWEILHRRPLKVFVNIAGNELTHPSYAQTVADALRAAGATGRHIALELTETALAERAIPAETLAALERAGVDLILDDFGTGFSSLSYLSRFPIATIKLDRSFIAGCSDDPARCVILDAVAHLARGLGLPALAEGIETPEQLVEVRSRGYSLAQGYLFARPQPACELDAMLAASRPFADLLVGGARAVDAAVV